MHYLNTNFEQASKVCDIAIEQVKNIIQKVNFYKIHIRLAVRIQVISKSLQSFPDNSFRRLGTIFYSQ
jgi:hypothetical protein